MEIVFATNNPHKVEEAKEILGPNFTIITLDTLGFEGDIPETHPTIRENSIQKASFIWQKFGKPCFADDTGLEVDYLNGAPGVYSARYSGDDKNPAANRIKLLGELEGVPFEKRTAHFICMVTLIEDGTPVVFEGRCNGHIALSESAGVQGFGYDKIFIPEGYEITMAELPSGTKAAIAHRGQAMRKLACYLQQNHGL